MDKAIQEDKVEQTALSIQNERLYGIAYFPETRKAVARATALIKSGIKKGNFNPNDFPFSVMYEATRYTADPLFAALRAAATGAHHHVYIILLHDSAREEQSGHKGLGKEGMPCVYVGQSWHPPMIRFNQHRYGERMSSRYVRKHGWVLLPDVYDSYNPHSAVFSKELEKALAEVLRIIGCTVFGGH